MVIGITKNSEKPKIPEKYVCFANMAIHSCLFPAFNGLYL